MKKEIENRLYNSKRNLIVTGDILTGKTTNILFPLVDKIINKEESLLMLDSKEEYINKYYKTLKDKNYNIIILNLKDLDKGDTWNPLTYPYNLYKNKEENKALYYLDSMAKSIFYSKSENEDPYWNLSAINLFIAVIFGLFEDGKDDEINLKSISCMIDTITERFGGVNYLINYFDNKDSLSTLSSYSKSIRSVPKDTALAIYSTVKQKINSFIPSEKMYMWLNKSSFDINNISNKKTAIFIINHNEKKDNNLLISMFIDQLFLKLFNDNNLNKFNFILDNFNTISHINDLSEKLGSGIYKNIKFIISTYSLEYLYDNYNKYLSSLCNIVYNTNNLIEFNIDGYSKKINKEYKNNITENQNINYYNSNLTTIKYFDLKKYVKNITRNNFIDKYKDGYFKDTSIDPNASNLINKINKRIEEIEKQGFLDNKNNIG